ncbi:hypothetical protein EJ03DRAFT_353761 [Teratosphaeria nubilosa]|uniref:Uncharacterized protein n=1 Tax=Teratosphaeria nubilosa TaxID=161662 RepID=A0A6G1L247_9PEZI|nr:hypothetical protein EJ03DRAFT_353761 [Teratosphaeria nubilosa]
MDNIEMIQNYMQRLLSSWMAGLVPSDGTEGPQCSETFEVLYSMCDELIEKSYQEAQRKGIASGMLKRLNTGKDAPGLPAIKAVVHTRCYLFSSQIQHKFMRLLRRAYHHHLSTDPEANKKMVEDMLHNGATATLWLEDLNHAHKGFTPGYPHHIPTISGGSVWKLRKSLYDSHDNNTLTVYFFYTNGNTQLESLEEWLRITLMEVVSSSDYRQCPDTELPLDKAVFDLSRGDQVPSNQKISIIKRTVSWSHPMCSDNSQMPIHPFSRRVLSLRSEKYEQGRIHAERKSITFGTQSLDSLSADIDEYDKIKQRTRVKDAPSSRGRSNSHRSDRANMDISRSPSDVSGRGSLDEPDAHRSKHPKVSHRAFPNTPAPVNNRSRGGGEAQAAVNSGTRNGIHVTTPSRNVYAGPTVPPVPPFGPPVGNLPQAQDARHPDAFHQYRDSPVHYAVTTTAGSDATPRV